MLRIISTLLERKLDQKDRERGGVWQWVKAIKERKRKCRMDRTDKSSKREKVNLNIPVVTLNINRLNTASKRLQAGFLKKFFPMLFARDKPKI